MGKIITTNGAISSSANVNFYSPELHIVGDSFLDGATKIKRTPVASDYTASLGDHLITVTDTTVSRTINLFSAVDGGAGYLLTVKDESGGAFANNILITPSGSQTIDGIDTISISADYGVLRIYSNGSNWFST
jgi:hypothetical protein